MHTTEQRRRILLVSALISAAVGLAACGSSAHTSAPTITRQPVTQLPAGSAGDSALIDQLRHAGAHMAKPRRVNFHAYIDTQMHAGSLETTLQEAGYDAEYEESGQGDFLVTGTKTMVVDVASIKKESHRFASIVTDAGAHYDGWEAAIKP